MKKLTAVVVMFLCLTLLLAPSLSIASDDNAALEKSFHELCGQLESVMGLPIEELNKMVVQCDTLKEKITQSTHPKKKVFLFRLNKCRKFLEFAIETKELESSKQ